MMDRASLIIDEAKSWLGTPYKHQSRLKGIGCDCVGLVAGVWEAIHGKPLPLQMPNYSPTWNDHRKDDPLVLETEKVLERVSQFEVAPGDVVVFRMHPQMAAKHCGILVSPTQFIHAYSRSSVRLENFNSFWKRKLVAGFKI
jgi:NlpC/P60 family putative phage cell wall peptidase